MKRKNNPAVKLLTSFLSIAAVLFLAAGPASAGEISIVSIDASHVLQSHPAFREAVSTYQKRQQEMQQRLSATDEAEQAMLQIQMQQELQKLGMQLQENARAKMQADVRKVAEENGYDYVVDAQSVITGNTDDLPDVTMQVIESFSE